MTGYLRIALLLGLFWAVTAQADDVQTLDRDYWAWRAQEQPFTSDDIPRLERPSHFRVDWSATTVERYRDTVTAFETRWKSLEPKPQASLADQVDYRLIGSAIARARFELDVSRLWARHPGFYIDQSLGSVYEVLLPPPPFTAERQATVLDRLEAIPKTLADARQNLTDLRAPFLGLAVSDLSGIDTKLDRLAQTLGPQFTPDNQRRLSSLLKRTAVALNEYRNWLETQRVKARSDTAIGPAAYAYFLHNVALLPYDPPSLLTLARAEWSRAVTFEGIEENRLRGTPQASIFSSSAAQVAAEHEQELNIRHFLTTHHLLTIPEDVAHYTNQLLPDYLEPLAFLGVSDDLTGPSRLHENAVSYIRSPRPDLPYFYLSTARDPRSIVVHEGVPGHYFQLVLGWRHPDPIRRHFYDSAANEGIGFYAEEMMLQAGLFDDQPRTRSTIYSFARLRALRVEVDVKLALGEFTLTQAADYLARTVPMDPATAMEEAASFAATPGQAISYQIGKTQILALLADARRREGDQFSLQRFQDHLWREGNVPFALTRLEMWGDRSELPELLPLPAEAP